MNCDCQSNDQQYFFENDLFQWSIDQTDGSISSTITALKDGNVDIVRTGFKEFSFTINGDEVYSEFESLFFNLFGYETEDLPDRTHLKINHTDDDQMVASTLLENFYYESCPEIAGIIKCMKTENKGNEKVIIEYRNLADVLKIKALEREK